MNESQNEPNFYILKLIFWGLILYKKDWDYTSKGLKKIGSYLGSSTTREKVSETVVSGGSASYFLEVPPRKKGRRRGKEKRGEELL